MCKEYLMLASSRSRRISLQSVREKKGGLDARRNRSHKYELIGHSHNGEDEPKPSPDDRAFLMETGQERSVVISARTGRMTDYTADPFEGRYTV